jgi:hypothetical protein
MYLNDFLDRVLDSAMSRGIDYNPVIGHQRNVPDTPNQQVSPTIDSIPILA